MISYHFDIGDSADGPIGFCARVTAPSRKRALQILRETLPYSLGVAGEHRVARDDGFVEYIVVYFNPSAVTLDNIDEEDEE